MATTVAKRKHAHGKTSATDRPTQHTNVSGETVIVDIDEHV